MVELVKDEAKLHITNGIEKASGASGVDIKVRPTPKHHYHPPLNFPKTSSLCSNIFESRHSVLRVV